MKYIPNLIQTNTTKGDHTLVRKRYLDTQIDVLKLQWRESRNVDKSKMPLIDKIAILSFQDLLNHQIEKFKHELSEWHDKTDEYNS